MLVSLPVAMVNLIAAATAYKLRFHLESLPSFSFLHTSVTVNREV